MSKRALWSERVKKLVRDQEQRAMLKAIYGSDNSKPVIAYKWVVTNSLSGVKCYYRKSAKIVDCWKQLLITERDGTTTYYSKTIYQLALCE